jgi:hypothetical protein
MAAVPIPAVPIPAVPIPFTELPHAKLTVEDRDRLISYRNSLPFPVRTESLVPIISGPKQSTVTKYMQVLKQLAQFSLLVRCDQTSLFLFRQVCPDIPGPIVASTLCAFLSYKVLPKGELVTHHRTHTTVADYRGNPIRADGGWNCYTNLECAYSAIMHMCNLYPSLLGEKLPYKAACPMCIALYSQQQTDPARTMSVPEPCMQCSLLHGNTAQIIPRGCVLVDEGVKQHTAKMKKLMQGHVRQGCIQLMPRDVRLIRDHLLLQCPADRHTSLNNLQVYCMFLVGINLFLRSEELLKLNFTDFVPAFTFFQPGTRKIQCLLFKVQGKSDTHVQYLRLWANNSHPELCPVIHLLIYIAMSGRTNGFVFPSLLNANHIFDYDKFLDIVKSLCVDVCGYVAVIRRFGTHTLRKTGYMFAIFGTLTTHGDINYTQQDGMCGITLSDIMASARHKSMSNAATYAKDCQATYQMVNLAGACSLYKIANRYVEWKPIHTHTLLSLERGTPVTDFIGKPLQFCANWFYETKLRLTPATTVLSAVSSACNSVSLTQQSTQDVFKKLQAMHAARFTPEEVSIADGYMQQIAIQNEIETSSPRNSESAAQEILPTQRDKQPQTAIAGTSSRTPKKKTSSYLWPCQFGVQTCCFMGQVRFINSGGKAGRMFQNSQ